jgi:hypothetical protein
VSCSAIHLLYQQQPNISDIQSINQTLDLQSINQTS